jgi:CRISPR-associated protein Cmr4
MSFLYYLHTLSPLHVGTGAATGAIDLPCSREVTTGLPNVPGSGIKGVLRDECDVKKSIAPPAGAAEEAVVVAAAKKAKDLHTCLFGGDANPDTPNRAQGALLFGDALLLCMPVVSLTGVFAYVTSPLALARYARQRAAVYGAAWEAPIIPTLIKDDAVCTTGATCVHNSAAYLYDLKLPVESNTQAKTCDLTTKWANLIAADVFSVGDPFSKLFTDRLVVVSDNTLAYFAHYCTEVRTRIRTDENKKAEDGALWTEESVPAEAIFYGTMGADTVGEIKSEANLAAFKAYFPVIAPSTQAERLFELGGKISVGRGVTRFILSGSVALPDAGAV